MAALEWKPIVAKWGSVAIRNIDAIITEAEHHGGRGDLGTAVELRTPLLQRRIVNRCHDLGTR